MSTPPSTPPGPKPLVAGEPAPISPPPGDGPDAPPHPGMTPAKDEAVNERAAPSPAGTTPQAPSPASYPTLREGAVYATPDGEERLVWALRNGIVEYFTRRAGGRWTGDPNRERPPPAAFAEQVGLKPG